MTNIPWRASIFQRLRDAMKFILWASLAVNCAIACYYSVMFTSKFFQFAWEWAKITMFTDSW